jgi:hypothetical protein
MAYLTPFSVSAPTALEGGMWVAMYSNASVASSLMLLLMSDAL